jgi:hypothetical protein
MMGGLQSEECCGDAFEVGTGLGSVCPRLTELTKITGQYPPRITCEKHGGAAPSEFTPITFSIRLQTLNYL